MITRSKTLWSLFTILCLSTFSARADVLSSPLTVGFSDATSAVWDLSGDYSFSHTIQGATGVPVPLFFGVTITNNVNGRLTGSGVTGVLIGNDFVAATYRVSGSVASAGTNRPAVFSITLSGQDFIAGQMRNFNITLNYNLKVASAYAALAGKVVGHASIQGSGSGQIKDTEFSIGLPAAQDGSWAVQVTFLALSQITGTAVVALADGQAFPALVTGSYSAVSNHGQVHIQGINEGRGVVVNLRFTVEDGVPVLDRMNGNMMGQQVKD